MPITREELSEICQQAMLMLKNDLTYTQVEVIKKMEYLGNHIAESTFTSILKGNAGLKTLVSTANTLQIILAKELGMEWVNGVFTRISTTDFKPEIIQALKPNATKNGYIAYEEERLTIPQKVAFFKDAQTEVIEFGLTLSRFASNLATGNSSEFRIPIEELLARGVNFKCFLAKISHETSAYFDDRKLIHPEEANFRRKIEEATQRMANVQLRFASMGYPGRFEVYEYTHLPYGYFMAVDTKTPNCRMLVSPYLYGIKRGEAPVFKIYKKDTPRLCINYLNSLAALIKNAKRIIPA